MTQQRANPRAQALTRICENLAYALPPYRDLLHEQLRHLTGHPDHYPGASEPTSEPTRLLEGKCKAPVAIYDYSGGDFLVDCGRPRPCPEHDRPVTLTIVERTAAERQRIQAELADIDQVLSTCALLAADLLKRARALAPLTPIAVPRCDATGLEGYLIPRPPHGDGWSDLTCTNPRSRGALCDACSQRSYRWRKAHGLPQHADGVYSQPAAGE